jgi:hypothetical protein
MSVKKQTLEIIKTKAFSRLSIRQQKTTNLHIDTQIHEKGEILGPRIQKITVKQPSILVFADDQPMANFSHDCRYLLFSPENGSLQEEIAAKFPPYGEKVPETLQPFHQPIQRIPAESLFRIWPKFRCPTIRPDGNRYAILFSGMSNLRHLNDLEFCYRMLIDRYGFSPDNIYCLNYDGTLKTLDGAAPSKWAGDLTSYRIKITGKGDRPTFQAAFNDIKAKIKAEDLLFIHTNNHGGNSSGQSYLCQYGTSVGPIHAWDAYWANDFCTDLKSLPKHKSLIVMMEQCESGGFNTPVIANSTATNRSIASAAPANLSSWGTSDGNFDVFALNWIAAQFGHNANGTALAVNPDANSDGVIQAEEAYNYVLAHDSADTPTYDESSTAGGDITLSQQNAFYWTWCRLWTLALEKHYKPRFPNPPDPEFYVKLNKILPEIQKTTLEKLTQTIPALETQLVKEIERKTSSIFLR